MRNYNLRITTKARGRVEDYRDTFPAKDINQLRRMLPKIFEDDLKDGVIEVQDSNNRHLGVFYYSYARMRYEWMNSKGKTEVSMATGGLIGKTIPHEKPKRR